MGVIGGAIERSLLVVSSEACNVAHRISLASGVRGQAIGVNREKEKWEEWRPTECFGRRDCVYKAWSTPKYVSKLPNPEARKHKKKKLYSPSFKSCQLPLITSSLPGHDARFFSHYLFASLEGEAECYLRGPVWPPSAVEIKHLEAFSLNS